ncbi:hypothetical protein QF043_000533 [Pseudomonas sp. W3I7]|uniref:hypothetical protein n=1 Tax=Pseudomonas sp. W3I7 TaxID=3042292 RepID=UPI0027944156|nr:hypothetical protein [Pseudomonas sp. W3I7]MDQ0701741.1 hypothetical protein [Pseudomonas sp. W3I7]
MKASVALIKFENGQVEQGRCDKKQVNPPIGAIKDRLIGGFGGKNEVSNLSYKLMHQSWLIGKWGPRAA